MAENLIAKLVNIKSTTDWNTMSDYETPYELIHKNEETQEKIIKAKWNYISTNYYLVGPAPNRELSLVNAGFVISKLFEWGEYDKVTEIALNLSPESWPIHDHIVIYKKVKVEDDGVDEIYEATYWTHFGAAVISEGSFEKVYRIAVKTAKREVCSVVLAENNTKEVLWVPGDETEQE